MTKKILFFNGPPRCGKDTAALHTILKFGHRWAINFDRFAMPIKRAFAGMTDSYIDTRGNVEPYESTKSDVIPWLGVSYRQWQIDFSEGFLKKYGDDIFARLFIQRNSHDNADAIVVPDSGFECEVAPIAEKFGRENVLLVRTHRPGCDFSSDSRSYLPDGLIDETHDVQNDGTIEQYHEKLDVIVEKFLARG